MSGEPARAAARRSTSWPLIRIDLIELLRLSGPMVAGRVGIMTMGLTDSIIVGRYSAAQLGYLALAWAVVSTVLNSSLGLLQGVQIMTSRALGEGNMKETGAALRRGLVYGLWIGVAAGFALGVGGPVLLSVLRLKSDLVAGASRPLIVFAVSMPSFMISVAASVWLEGLGRPKPATILMWVANIANVAVDLILVPGHFGIPAMGAMGGACATFTARTVLAIGCMAYILRMKDARALGVFDRAPRDKWREVEQRRLGYGAGASNFFEVSAFAGMSVIAGWISTLTVAAWAVVINIVAFVFMFPLGLATATAVMVGRAYGARDFPALRRGALVGFSVAAIFGVLVGVVIWPTAPWIASGYTLDPATVALAAPALVLSSLFLLPDAMQVVVAQALRARGDVLVPTLTHLTSYVAVMIPLAYVLAIPLGLGLAGIVWSVIDSSFISAGLLLIRFWMLSRRD